MESVSSFLTFSPWIGAAGFMFAMATYAWVLKQPAGNAKMIGIATLIENGSMTFLKKEYLLLLVFLFLVTVLLKINLGTDTALCYLIGAFSSMLCGFLGMKAATKANVRTAQAAAQNGQGKALTVAFFGGSVMGMSVASIGLVGIALLYKYLSGETSITAINGFAMGASSIALFARVGGGIYTKAADVGADLVGKLRPVFLKTTQEILQQSQITLVTMLVILLEWELTYLNHIVVQLLPQCLLEHLFL